MFNKHLLSFYKGSMSDIGYTNYVTCNLINIPGNNSQPVASVKVTPDKAYNHNRMYKIYKIYQRCHCSLVYPGLRSLISVKG